MPGILLLGEAIAVLVANASTFYSLLYVFFFRVPSLLTDDVCTLRLSRAPPKKKINHMNSDAMTLIHIAQPSVEYISEPGSQSRCLESNLKQI